MGRGVLVSYRDAVRFEEPSNAKAARPKPRAPADAVRARTERPVHLEACPEVAGLVALPVEGLFRYALAENGRREPPMKRRIALVAAMTRRRQTLHNYAHLL